MQRLPLNVFTLLLALVFSPAGLAQGDVYPSKYEGETFRENLMA